MSSSFLRRQRLHRTLPDSIKNAPVVGCVVCGATLNLVDASTMDGVSYVCAQASDDAHAMRRWALDLAERSVS